MTLRLLPAALESEELERANPLERPEKEGDLHGPRRPRAPHEEESEDGQDEGDQRDLPREQVSGERELGKAARLDHARPSLVESVDPRGAT